MRTLFPVCRYNLQLCPHMMQRALVSRVLSHKDTNPIHKGSALMTSSPPRPTPDATTSEFWGGRGAQAVSPWQEPTPVILRTVKLGVHLAISPSAQPSLCTEVIELRYLETFRG